MARRTKFIKNLRARSSLPIVIVTCYPHGPRPPHGVNLYNLRNLRLLPPQVHLTANANIKVGLSMEHAPSRPSLNAEGDQWRRFHEGLGDGGDNLWLIESYAVEVRFESTDPCRIERIVVPFLHNRHRHVDRVMQCDGVPLSRNGDFDIHHAASLNGLGWLRFVDRCIFPNRIMLDDRRFFHLSAALPNIQSDAQEYRRQ